MTVWPITLFRQRLKQHNLPGWRPPNWSSTPTACRISWLDFPESGMNNAIETGGNVSTAHTQQAFLKAVYSADNLNAVAALKGGIDVNSTDPRTGLTALHIAVSTNNLSLTQILVEDWHAAFKADARGRWPTLLAAEAQVDDALSDYIVEAEAKACYRRLVLV